MPDLIKAKSRLVIVAKELYNKYKHEFSKKRKMQLRSELSRPDFLWHALLVSYSTWGNSRGYAELIENPVNYNMVTYHELKKLNKLEREKRLHDVMHKAKVLKYHEAPRLADCFERIEAMGGITEANMKFFSLKTAEDIINFLYAFPGIGEKYARNIPMDYYHPLFQNYIAIDARIKKISKELELPLFKSYRDHEQFYLNVAKSAGIQGWELDRLIFSHKEEFLANLSEQSQGGSTIVNRISCRRRRANGRS